MLDTPYITRGTGKQLRGFLTHIKQHVNSLLVALKLPVKEWYLILVYPFTQKFDYQTHRAYELEKNIGLISSDKQALLPTLDAFLTFLEKRCTALENIEVDNSKRFNNHGNKNMSGEKNERKSFFAQKQNHSFAGQKGCITCKRRHHALLHDDQLSNADRDTSRNKGSTNNCDNADLSASIQGQGNTLMGTSGNEFIGGKIKYLRHVCYEQLDTQTGSQTNFITKELIDELGRCEIRKTFVKIGGISNKTTDVETMVNLTLESKVNNYTIKTQFAVLDKITFTLPHVWVDLRKVKIDKEMKIADPFYNRPGHIDMLISADLYARIILPQVVKLPAPIIHHENDQLRLVCCSVSDAVSDHELVDIDELMPKFWQMEELQNKTFFSREEKLCENLFLQSCTRLENGSFQVDLSMRSNKDFLQLGDCFHSAYRRFQFLENKFIRNPALFSDYKSFIEEHIELNHGKYVECNSEEIQKRIFLAHHCVIKKDVVYTTARCM
ncbi:hypothetical protein D910_09025 [Dendroctonus ponderosae]|uniref:Uncharacterized protein n=1 Tax=Dendroctonus ponderosae TaxID=77166 RepID=U4UH54_DENPD|nr:hypothetical protein D910_09025 [Dendroctonus ponderosae]